MADNGSIDCPCSNIAIMQLFHELKQRYPTVPDQIVSKVIQENCHDKSACELILSRENTSILQSYPGALISRNWKENVDRRSVCKHCPGFKVSSCSGSTAIEAARSSVPTAQAAAQPEPPASLSEENCIYLHRREDATDESMIVDESHLGKEENKTRWLKYSDVWTSTGESLLGNFTSENDSQECLTQPETNCDKKTEELVSDVPMGDPQGTEVSPENLKPERKISSDPEWSTSTSRTCYSDCDSEIKLEISERSHSCDLPKVEEEKEGEGKGNKQPGSGQVSVHNYQVAVQYSTQPSQPVRKGDQQRSYTTLNFNIRPPSSVPQAPIEIRSGQNLTYTSSVYDAKNGVQSQFQIMIGPGGGGGASTMSTCRSCNSWPDTRYSTCRHSFCNCSNWIPQISSGYHCQNNHCLKALLEKQRERKNLLAWELRKEQDKLQHMQNEVRLMKASIAQKPSPHLLPKLKTEIEKLRAECEKLTAAVDLYSDTQNILPLGETDEEFYRNIYTGQTLQREGSWSCQLCTFRNHPLLNVCEECEMPRISLGTQVMDVASHLSNVLSNNSTSFCTGGGTSTSATLITAPLQEQ